MKPAFHYEFIAKIIKIGREDGEYEFIETRKEFFDDEPLKAREEALNYYKNYIEGMLEYIGLKYESDRQAREALKSFHNPGTKSKVEIGGKEFYLPVSLGNGIGVFIVIDNEVDNSPDEPTSAWGNYDLIHGIGSLREGFFDEEFLILSLERELFYYQHFNYDTSDYLTKIVFCNSDEWRIEDRDTEPQEYTILKTPFDWTGLDKPYWWGKPNEDEEEDASRLTLEELIKEGESNHIEFKLTLLYNFKTKAASIGVKGIIAKSICAFLNSNGGWLFIGINNDGIAQGLEYDFSLSDDKSPKDFFRLEFDDMIKQFFPLFAKTFIYGDFYNIAGKEVFVISVRPSTSKPVFIKGQHGKEFWVRWTASTRQYTDIEDITNYCLEHWRTNSKQENDE